LLAFSEQFDVLEVNPREEGRKNPVEEKNDL